MSVPVKQNIENSSNTHQVIAKAIEKAGIYNYVKVEENDREYWIAIPEKDIKIGETYYYKGGMKMVNFESKELKTYSCISIYFHISFNVCICISPKEA